MVKRRRSVLGLVRAGVVGLLVLGVVGIALAGAGRLDEPLKSQVKSSIDRGLKYLRFHQEDNGSWNNYPGITALVVRAFIESPRRYTEEDGPFVRKALAYLIGKAKPNGAIYDHDLPNYNTAVAVQALQASGNPRYRPLVEKAQAFLLDSQLDETKGYAPAHRFYGAIGLGGSHTKQQPDLDNLGFALAALKVSGVAKAHPMWQKALTFLKRTQNRKASNDQAWAGDDGGFVFRPGFSYAGGTLSYASMTYVGLQSLLYTHVPKDDPKVQAAFAWLQTHYSVEENTGFGQQALYHYYYFMANALYAYGAPVLVDAKGTQHEWRRELAEELLLQQDFDGHWVNEAPQWWEGNPILATTFAVLALERIYND